MCDSANAKKAAGKFIQNIRSGNIAKDTLPNSFENYTDFLEQADLESYKKYIRTLTYFDCIEKREVLYFGD